VDWTVLVVAFIAGRVRLVPQHDGRAALAVLADVIASGVVPVVRLTEVFR
jgi:hypothetical protein